MSMEFKVNFWFQLQYVKSWEVNPTASHEKARKTENQ